MKRWALAGLGLVVAVVVLGMLLLPGSKDTVPADAPKVTLAGATYEVAIMSTDEERQRGLSGTSSLPEGAAMLFVYPRDGRWGIWMKDMNYAIDIVWLDSDAKVVHMVEDAQPDSYPETTFYPSVMSRYVIELPSGTIKKTAVEKGMHATLPSGV